MKVKVYKVVPKKNTNGVFYMVDAPNKRIAKWCGANLYNNDYMAFLSAKDMVAERFRIKGGTEEMKNKRTRITFNLRTKGKKQLPLFMIIKEYYDEQGQIEFAEVLFEIKGRKCRNLLKRLKVGKQ